MVRASIVIVFASVKMKNYEEDIGNIVEKTSKGSLINHLISTEKWEELFKNPDWLNVLETIQNLNTMRNGVYTKYLQTIYKYFHEETEGFLCEAFFL
jgi:hypothetical protein